MRGKERDALPHVVVYVEYVVYVGHPYVELQLMRVLWRWDPFLADSTLVCRSTRAHDCRDSLANGAYRTNLFQMIAEPRDTLTM